MENKQVRVGVGVIVKKEDKVIMFRRKVKHGEGYWCFPGGHLEFGESIEDCARREVMEEVGIKIKNLKIGPYTNNIFSEDDKHYITLFVIGDYDSGEVINKEPDKAEEIDWFDSAKLPLPLFAPIKNLIEGGFNV